MKYTALFFALLFYPITIFADSDFLTVNNVIDPIRPADLSTVYYKIMDNNNQPCSNTVKMTAIDTQSIFHADELKKPCKKLSEFTLQTAGSSGVFLGGSKHNIRIKPGAVCKIIHYAKFFIAHVRVECE